MTAIFSWSMSWLPVILVGMIVTLGFAMLSLDIIDMAAP